MLNIKRTHKINFILGLATGFLLIFVSAIGLSTGSGPFWSMYSDFLRKMFSGSADSSWALGLVFCVLAVPFFLLNLSKEAFREEISSEGFPFLATSFLIFFAGVFAAFVLALVFLMFAAFMMWSGFRGL